MIEEWRGSIYFLSGFENNAINGAGCALNFIFSNGARTKQRDKNWNYFDHIIPEGAHKMIRRVYIHIDQNIFLHYDSCVEGFSFCDNNCN